MLYYKVIVPDYAKLRLEKLGFSMQTEPSVIKYNMHSTEKEMEIYLRHDDVYKNIVKTPIVGHPGYYNVTFDVEIIYTYAYIGSLEDLTRILKELPDYSVSYNEETSEFTLMPTD